MINNQESSVVFIRIVKDIQIVLSVKIKQTILNTTRRVLCVQNIRFRRIVQIAASNLENLYRIYDSTTNQCYTMNVGMKVEVKVSDLKLCIKQYSIKV